MRRKLPGFVRMLTTKAVLFCAAAMLCGPLSGPAQAQQPSAQASGQQTYSQVCASCHDSGAMGAPKFGSKADWAPRIKQGKQTLYQNAITGIGAMPPKGGQPSLSDADVKAAVDYMVAEVSGGGGGQQQATGSGTSKSGSSAGANKKAPAQPDPKVGRLKADTCMGCHGIPGYMMVYPTYPVPKLGGQHPEYIVSALQQYKTGERKNSTMQAQALALSNKDMQDIAAYFSSLAPEGPELGGGSDGQQQATKGGGNKVAEASPEATAGGGSAQASGQQTYSQVCASCHDSGAMGAPKFGSKADWAPRIKQGKQTLYQNAITGIGAMPPKGGQPSLSDADVKAAVDYMVAEVSGGGGGQQQATKGGGNTARKAPPKAQMGPGIKVAAARGASPENESTYQAMCSTCHSSGALGAPKITDKAAWQPRIAQGPKVLYSSALNGIGAMPAKGGHPQLSDEQVKAAVDYIVSAVTATTGQTAAAEKSQSGKAKQGQ